MADELNNTALELNKITVNGYEFEVADSGARTDIGDISDAIIINNASISSRINNLNSRLETIENTEYATKDELEEDEEVISTSLHELNDRLEILEANPGSGSGSSGAQGAQGSAGPQGETGSQGAQGSAGPQGETGAQGSEGAQGPQGPAGDGEGGSIDAYTKTESDEKYATIEALVDDEEVIAEAISQIRENELLNAVALTDLTARIDSLEDDIENGGGGSGTAGAQGAQGAVGPQGPAGTTGEQGPQGNQGKQGAKGANGTNGTNGTNGSQGAQGPQGEQGDSRVPAYTSSDNGKILMIVNGQLTFVNPVHLYAGTAQPSNVDGYDGDLFIQITE